VYLPFVAPLRHLVRAPMGGDRAPVPA
jgi:hypothetical protein